MAAHKQQQQASKKSTLWSCWVWEPLQIIF